MREFLRAKAHLLIQAYWIIYLTWFFYLEKYTKPKIWLGGVLDRRIPFCQWFVYPYIFWFFYVAIGIIYFLCVSKKEYYQLCTFLFTGMTICLVIYTIFPNGQSLRPPISTLPDDFASQLVKMFYQGDSPTNVCPSIHCLNSIGVHLAVRESPSLKNRKLLRTASFITAVLICMSTVFIKQHALVDVFWACVLSLFLYWLVYRTRPRYSLANANAVNQLI